MNVTFGLVALWLAFALGSMGVKGKGDSESWGQTFVSLCRGDWPYGTSSSGTSAAQGPQGGLFGGGNTGSLPWQPGQAPGGAGGLESPTSYGTAPPHGAPGYGSNA